MSWISEVSKSEELNLDFISNEEQVTLREWILAYMQDTELKTLEYKSEDEIAEEFDQDKLEEIETISTNEQDKTEEFEFVSTTNIDAIEDSEILSTESQERTEESETVSASEQDRF